MEISRFGGHDYLFNVDNDPMERANKKHIETERFTRMQSERTAWNETMLPYPEHNKSWSNKFGGFIPDRY